MTRAHRTGVLCLVAVAAAPAAAAGGGMPAFRTTLRLRL
jgi:hypothetical protein